MKNLVRSFLAVLVVTLISSHASLAACSVDTCGVAPEIDPAMGAGALALVGGAIMVIRGRARAKK
jgi:hypothetical protein